MKDFGKTRSTIKPEAMVIDDYYVWINHNIKEIHEKTGEDEVFDGWEYTMKRYDKNEYITEISHQLTQTQEAMCEIYEMM